MNRRGSQSKPPDPSGHPAAPLVSAPVAVPSSRGDPGQRGSSAAANRVHLLFCTDAVYLQHVAVCLTSLLVNNPELFFDIVIVRRATETLDEPKLRRSLAPFPNHSLLFRVFTTPVGRVLPLNPRAHYTIDTWTRLWVEEFFPPDVDRVLYLDGDTVVTGDISPLWNVDLGGALLGTVDIPGSQRGVTHLEMRAEDGYFNAGVLLIDLKQWRETKAVDTVLGYVDAYPERMTRDVDQEALNACFHARRKRLDFKWNVVWSFFRQPEALPLAREEVEAICREARIIHFNGHPKPWSYFCDHPRKTEYEKYLRMTEWRGFVPPDRTLLNRLRKSVAPLLPGNLKAFLRTIALQLADRRRPSRYPASP
jgi:lipopolysaccharide biosynthesis glycosyltransferase